MLKLVVLVAIAGVVASEVTLQQVFQKHWSAFKGKHNKEYTDPDEEDRRIQNYLDTSLLIEEHNLKYHKKEVSFKLEHNHMSDLDPQEAEELYMGLKVPAPEKMLNGTAVFKSTLGDRQIPKRIDWRDWDLVTRVKDQGRCGSCYTFAATAAVETAIARRTRKLVELSEQQMLDCTEKYGNYGCRGGYMNGAMQYIIDNGGQITAADYPYKGVVNEKCLAPQYKPHANINNFVVIAKGDEKTMAEAIATVGPLAMAFHAGKRHFMMYKEGIYDSDGCDTSYLSHAAAIIGYGTEDGKDYWLVKNSWGKHWGEDGYFRMVRGKNMCGIANLVSYPIA